MDPTAPDAAALEYRAVPASAAVPGLKSQDQDAKDALDRIMKVGFYNVIVRGPVSSPCGVHRRISVTSRHFADIMEFLTLYVQVMAIAFFVLFSAYNTVRRFSYGIFARFTL